jgi:mannose-6-phosphate isomerase-like protein (cupin superfamily)
VIEKINLKDKLNSFRDTWSPKIVGELNGQYVKLVKFEGEYVWHQHDNEDEMFLILEGRMDLHLPNGVTTVDKREFIIVPRGVQHKPEAKELCQALLFEPVTTRNTGKVDHSYTIEPDDLERI